MTTYLPIALCVVGLSLGFLTEGCKKEPPVEPEKPATLTLTAEDASCTEVWLKATTTETPATVRLLRDGQRLSDLRLLTSDSLLFNEGLLPNRAYTYQLQKLATDSSVNETSASVQLTTMDTTSHNFTWHIDTLGVTSSVLYDVAIINDTLAYAVGEIFLNDSTGTLDPIPYNLAVWNGRRWDIRRLNYRGSPPVLRFVFAISEQDIWFDPWFHWNGQQFVEVPINPVFIGVQWNKMWGSPDGKLYVVGNNGTIAYSPDRGSTWQRVESGTTIEISDIYGAMNRRTGGWEIIAAAGNPYVDPQRKILQVNGTTVTALSDAGIDRAISGIWFAPGKRYWLVGDGLWYSNYSSTGFQWQNKSGIWTQFALGKVRGNDVNDVFMVGSYGEVLHFNGATIKSFRGATGTDLLYLGLSVRGDQIMAVGIAPPRAVVVRGRRAR